MKPVGYGKYLKEHDYWVLVSGIIPHPREGYEPVYRKQDVLEIVEQFRAEQNPPHKEYENNYNDGWLDACNEIYYAIEKENK
jgi:hypothetical protein